MRADIITQAVPHADPDFLRIMGQLSDPPPGIYEKVMRLLPKLHELFLQKRQASEQGDIQAVAKIIDQETELMRQAMGVT